MVEGEKKEGDLRMGGNGLNLKRRSGMMSGGRDHHCLAQRRERIGICLFLPRPDREGGIGGWGLAC